MKKLITIATIAIMLTLTMGNVNAVGKEISVKVNGNMIAFPDAKPFINQDNRTLVPVRFVSEAMGATVSWTGGNERLVTIEKDSTRVVLKVGEKFAIVNDTKGDQRVEFDTTAVIKDERCYVPLRFISECMGAHVSWDGFLSTAMIFNTQKKYSLPIDPNSGLTEEQILKLKEYPDKADSYEFYYVGSNKAEIDNQYMPNEVYLARPTGMEEAKMACARAKGHLEAIHNVDYQKGLEKYKENEKPYVEPQNYKRTTDFYTKYFNDYKIVVEGHFYTDPSLVYIDSEGHIRVRGTIRYIVYSCSNIEKAYGKGAKLNMWMEEDLDVELSTLTSGKWEYYYSHSDVLSPNPRYN